MQYIIDESPLLSTQLSTPAVHIYSHGHVISTETTVAPPLDRPFPCATYQPDHTGCRSSGIPVHNDIDGLCIPPSTPEDHGHLNTHQQVHVNNNNNNSNNNSNNNNNDNNNDNNNIRAIAANSSRCLADLI